ncbi:MAG: hypothetical protein HY917_00615 [Candidatus Diapherotrites archaeon]|nr:hypothetical protein [Candidatus Diapherotrites archaeon]
MKAVFVVKTLEADWKPPFKKTESIEEFQVAVGEGFDRFVGNGNDEDIFAVKDIRPPMVDLAYSKLFTMEGIPSAKHMVVTLRPNEEKIIRYLWGEKGITKRIKLSDIVDENQ